MKEINAAIFKMKAVGDVFVFSDKIHIHQIRINPIVKPDDDSLSDG